MSELDFSDQDLVSRIREGDHHAFQLLFEKHFEGLLRFASAQLRSSTDAEDVVQDVFVRLWTGRGRLTDGLSIRSYLLAAVRNGAIDQLRRRKRERRWLEPPRTDAPSDRDVDSVALGGSMVPPDSAALAELDGAIRAAIAALPERCRVAFLLCRDQGLTYAEAADVMGVGPGTVKTQMGRALGALRTALEPFLAVVAAVATLAR